MNVLEILILILLAVLTVLAVILLVKISRLSRKDTNEEVLDAVDEVLERQGKDKTEVLREVWNSQSKYAEGSQKAMLEGFARIQQSTEKRLDDNQKVLNDTIVKGLSEIQHSTNLRLGAIQADMNAKLDKSLNERLDSSFKAVGDRLEALYQSLGELKNLESGVSNLNRTLSNVKSRGVFGEMQLENILANLLTSAQYGANVSPKNNGDSVEFAVKIPDKEDRGFLWLPIDSKFPLDIYEKIVKASEEADPEGLAAAVQELKNRIRLEAAVIREKYIAPPVTTDFAIMFLPTESLFAEVLRVPGLCEEIQQKQKVIICGPTTLSAVINSLSVGFKYLSVNKKSEQIMKTLGAFKTQFAKFDELLASVSRSLTAAQNKTAELADRSRIVRNRLGKVETLSYEESNELLGIAQETEEAEQAAEAHS